MKPSTDKYVYLVRHCEAFGQAPDDRLTPRGEEQAEILAERLAHLSIDRIVTSPYLRARESIRPLASRLQLPVETDDRLIERRISDRPVPDWQEVLARSFEDLDLRIAGGESSREAMARGAAVLAEIRHGPCRQTLLVTHGNMLALIMKSIDDSVGFDTWRRLSNPDVFRINLTGASQTIERLWPEPNTDE